MERQYHKWAETISLPILHPEAGSPLAKEAKQLLET